MNARYTIDIDNGGTFTDGFFTCGDQVRKVKVETTPHDLTVCFTKCIEEGARSFGLKNVREILRSTDVLRFSSTVGTNSLIQKTGPKLGLIVTHGFEDSLYQEDGAASPVMDVLVSRPMIMGLEERIDSDGNEVVPVSEKEVCTVARRLLETGARVIVVSLLNSSINPEHEREIKRIITQDYPPYYLGTVTVLPASEVTSRPGEALRTHTAVINAYLHKDMVKYLYKANEYLLQSGYTRPLLICHSKGGVARVAKTRAIDTCNSGPAAGLMGSSFISRFYGIPHAVTVDVGGTSTDVGLILEKSYTYSVEPRIEGIPINVPLIDVNSIGGGGGSIAKVDPHAKTLKVGPESAGAMPGPVCYDLGGTEPTALDADVVLGFVNPDYFLGGRRNLNREKALKAIEERIAKPLDVDVYEAASRIRQSLLTLGGEELRRMMRSKGCRPEDFVLFAFGGGGGLLCCGMADHVGISRIITFSNSSVFSAFGSSTMDIVHTYEMTERLTLQSSRDSFSTDPTSLNQLIEPLQRLASRDMRGEGFGKADILFELELELRNGAGSYTSRIRCPGLRIERKEDLKALCASFIAECVAAGHAPGGFPEGGIELAGLTLTATCRIPHADVSSHEPVGKDPKPALKGMRDVSWDKAFLETPVYDHKLLRCGNRVTGPAIIEAEDTTYVIPEGKVYSVDNRLNGIIEGV